MQIILGKTQCSMIDPPNDGQVIIGEQTWKIGRNGSGFIVLRQNGQAHPDFYNGMDMSTFVHWINGQLQ